MKMKATSLRSEKLEKQIVQQEKFLKSLKLIKKEIEKVANYTPKNKYEVIAQEYVKLQNINKVLKVIQEKDIKNNDGRRFTYDELKGILSGKYTHGGAKVRANIVRVSKAILDFNTHCTEKGQNTKKGNLKQVVESLKNN